MEPTKTWDKLGFENPLKKTCLHDYTGETNKNVIDNPRTESAQNCLLPNEQCFLWRDPFESASPGYCRCVFFGWFLWQLKDWNLMSPIWVLQGALWGVPLKPQCIIENSTHVHVSCGETTPASKGELAWNEHLSGKAFRNSMGSHARAWWNLCYHILPYLHRHPNHPKFLICLSKRLQLPS